MLELLQRANDGLVSMFGIGFLGIFGLGLRQLYKIAKEKRKENDLNREAFKHVIDNDEKQDRRLESLEIYRSTSDTRAKGMIKAQKASLHNQIWNKSEIYLKRGWIDVGELSNFEIMYHAYKSIGGNHTGDTLHEKVKALPVKDEGILREDEI